MDDVTIFISVYQIIIRLALLGLILFIYIGTNSELNESIPDYPFINNEEIKQFKNNNNTLRHLQDMSECFRYYTLLSGKDNISEIFDLGIPFINLFALIQLIVLVLSVMYNIFIIIYVPILKKRGVRTHLAKKELSIKDGIVAFVIEVIKFGLMIIFWIFYGKSEIIEYLDMFDCPDFNIDAFRDYNLIDRIDDCIIAFIVLNVYSSLTNILIAIAMICQYD